MVSLCLHFAVLSSLSLSLYTKMVKIDEFEEPPSSTEVNGNGEERTRAFQQLKPCCLELLELIQRPKKHCPAVHSLLQCLRSFPSDSLQPFFEYAFAFSLYIFILLRLSREISLCAQFCTQKY